MVNTRHWSSVQTLMTLITNCWQIHISLFVWDLNSLKPKQLAYKLTRRRGTQMH